MTRKVDFLPGLPVVALLSCLLLGACAAPVADAPGKSTLPKIAPDFTLSDVNGRQFTLADSAGKVRLIDFWATWCAPCREEIPMFKELQETYGSQGFELVTISDGDEGADSIREFVEEHEIEYLSLIGTEEVARSYVVPGLPTAFLVDGEGRIVEKWVGIKPRRVVEGKIRELLELPPV